MAATRTSAVDTEWRPSSFAPMSGHLRRWICFQAHLGPWGLERSTTEVWNRLEERRAPATQLRPKQFLGKCCCEELLKLLWVHGSIPTWDSEHAFLRRSSTLQEVQQQKVPRSNTHIGIAAKELCLLEGWAAHPNHRVPAAIWWTILMPATYVHTVFEIVRKEKCIGGCVWVSLPAWGVAIAASPEFSKKKLLRNPAPIFQLRMFQHPHIDPTSETLQKTQSYLPGRSNKKHSSSSEHHGETFWQNAGWHSHTIMLNPTTSRTYLCSDMKCETPAPCSHMHPGTHMSSEICSRTIFYIHPDMLPGKCSDISFDIDPGSIFTYFYHVFQFDPAIGSDRLTFDLANHVTYISSWHVLPLFCDICSDRSHVM